MNHDPTVHPVDCPAKPEGAETCDTYAHSKSGQVCARGIHKVPYCGCKPLTQ